MDHFSSTHMSTISGRSKIRAHVVFLSGDSETNIRMGDQSGRIVDAFDHNIRKELKSKKPLSEITQKAGVSFHCFNGIPFMGKGINMKSWVPDPILTPKVGGVLSFHFSV